MNVTARCWLALAPLALAVQIPRHHRAGRRERRHIDEGTLSSVLAEFARTLLTDFPIQAILDHLVERIVDVLPVTGAGVTLIWPGAAPLYVAASDSAALRFEQLQTTLGQGPCVVAYATGEPAPLTGRSARTDGRVMRACCRLSRSRRGRRRRARRGRRRRAAAGAAP